MKIALFALFIKYIHDNPRELLFLTGLLFLVYLAFRITASICKLLQKRELMYSIILSIVLLLSDLMFLDDNKSVYIQIIATMIRSIPISLAFVYVIRYEYLSKIWLKIAFITSFIISFIIISESIVFGLMTIVPYSVSMIFIFSCTKYCYGWRKRNVAQD